VLPLDPRHGLLDVGQDRPVEQVRCPALPHQVAEHLPVKSARHGVAFLLRVGQASQGAEKVRPGVDHLHGDAHAGEDVADALRLVFPHQGTVDEDRAEPIAQGPMTKHRDHRAVDASAQGVDRTPAADRPANLRNLLLNKRLVVHAIPFFRFDLDSRDWPAWNSATCPAKRPYRHPARLPRPGSRPRTMRTTIQT
jgi:hypothetical protein